MYDATVVFVVVVGPDTLYVILYPRSPLIVKNDVVVTAPCVDVTPNENAVPDKFAGKVPCR